MKLMNLYGTDACADCVIARKLLEKYNQSHVWIDVSCSPGFEGEIPRLVILGDVSSTSVNNKLVIVGLNNISKYLKECLW